MKVQTALISSACAVLSANSHAQSCQLDQPQILTSPTPDDAQEFGIAAALGGDILVISDALSENVETVFVYRKQGSDWVFDDTITIPVPFLDDYRFGANLAVHDGKVIVASPDEDDSVIGISAGALYIYEEGQGGWEIQQRLTASDAAADDQFGYFQHFGDTLIVSASGGTTNGQNGGALYVFEYDGTQWLETAKLEPTVPAPLNYEFGPATRVGDTIFVGNPLGSNAAGVSTGIVHELRLSNGEWEYHTTHAPFNTSDNSAFGRWIAAQGDTLFVGDPGDALDGLYSGTVYVYRFDGNEWLFDHHIRPSDGAFGAWFGEHLAVKDNNLFVSGNTLLTSDLPAIYHFELSNDTWVERQKIVTPTNIRFSFARNFSVSDQTLIAPDPNGPTLASNMGLVYVYDIQCDDCPADVNGDGMLSPTDFSAWIGAYNANAPECDQNNDGMCTPTDFTAWVGNYNAGC